jgi:hypothetical protein
MFAPDCVGLHDSRLGAPIDKRGMQCKKVNPACFRMPVNHDNITEVLGKNKMRVEKRLMQLPESTWRVRSRPLRNS